MKGASGACDGPCEGACSVPLKAPKCEGDLKAPSCPVSGDCEAECKASAQARANCTAPAVFIGAQDDFAGAIDILSGIGTMQRNLSVLFSANKARGPQLEAELKGAYEAGGRIVADNTKLGPKGQACARVMLASGEQALNNIHVAIDASKSVLLTLPLER